MSEGECPPTDLYSTGLTICLHTLMLFDAGFVGARPEDAIKFVVDLLQSSTEYSMIGKGLDGTILLWNEGARLLYGYTASEVLGKCTASMLHTPEEISAGIPQLMMQQARAHGKWEGILTRVRKNGQRFSARAVMTPRKDSVGNHVGYLLISRDVSAEIPVVEAIEKFRVLLASAPDAMMILNEFGAVLVANPQAEKLFGYPIIELIGQQLEMLMPERFRHGHTVFRHSYFAEPQARAMGEGRDLFGLHREGMEFPIEVSLSPLESDGQLYVICAARDITSRMRADAKFRGLLESAPDAMVIVDQRGRIVMVNSQVERLFGYRKSELSGQAVELLMSPRYRENHTATFKDYLEKPGVRPMGRGLSLFGMTKDGIEFPVEISLSPIETEDGVLVSSSIRDVTEQKNNERLLQEKNIELENANLAKDRFLASMSHELRTPLNAILGFTGTLLMRLPGSLTQDQESQLRTIQTSGRHLLSLINDLLDLAKIESGKVEFHREPVRCLDVAQEVSNLLQHQVQAKGLWFEVSAESPALCVIAERRALTQILFNLASNAIKFTAKGGVRLRIARRLEGGQRLVDVCIHDTGEGIRFEDQARLFQPFTQVAGAQGRPQDGTGLGLYLSRKLAELNGGGIRLESEPGQGSSFTLFLEEAE